MPARTRGVTALAVGIALAAIGLGVDWIRPSNLNVPGRVLAARLFLVVAAACGIAAIAQATRHRQRAVQLATAGAAAMVAAFAVTVRQIGLANISPTALIVVAAALASFVGARRGLRTA